MADPQSKWGLRLETRRTSKHSHLSENSNGSSSLTGEAAILQYLKDLAVTGGHKLDGILRAVAEAAQRNTGATGAAVAMWKDGAMVCRARSGDTAPPLGAKLSSDTGISGECLRTGQIQYCADTENDPRVDVEVCRTLGLRSLAVLPIQGWRGINGILEVFSTEPDVFSQSDLAFLQQLAAVAERARTFQPQGASGISKAPPLEAEPQLQGMLPASDRVRDVAAIFFAGRSRPFVIAGAVIAMFLLGVVIWLGWRGPAEASPAAQATPGVISKVEAARPLDNDPVWAENPGGEKLIPQKASAGIPVKMASDVEVIPQTRIKSGGPLLAADAAAMSMAPHQPVPNPVEEAMVVEPPALPAADSHSSAMAPLLGSPVSSPQLAHLAVSQGVTGGRLTHRVSPAYPPQALVMRLQGKVILEATIIEDGSLRDLKVVEGHPLLAKSAVQAVERWRYAPYQLDGHPVKRQTTITVDFKLPSDTPSH